MEKQRDKNTDLAVSAYQKWGFKGSDKEAIQECLTKFAENFQGIGKLKDSSLERKPSAWATSKDFHV